MMAGKIPIRNTTSERRRTLWYSRVAVRLDLIAVIKTLGSKEGLAVLLSDLRVR